MKTNSSARFQNVNSIRSGIRKWTPKGVHETHQYVNQPPINTLCTNLFIKIRVSIVCDTDFTDTQQSHKSKKSEKFEPNVAYIQICFSRN